MISNVELVQTWSARARVRAEFARRFGEPASLLVRAPGRINLIGEHTDYSEGFVLPFAIDRELCIALRARTDGTVHVHSLDFNESSSFLADAPGQPGANWDDYIKGVAWALRSAGHELSGWEGVLSGDIPRGAGLSSSAALGVAGLFAFAASSNFVLDPLAAARSARTAENEWVGVNSGIMDPLVIAAGRRDHALRIDCRTHTIEAVPFPANAAVVILDTGTKRALVDSRYNERRAQCEAAARSFGVDTLRDLAVTELLANPHAVELTSLKRARHVVTENQRTLHAADALRRADLARLGQLMNESHSSLRDDFEVSSEALDTMVALATETQGCFGARMTGAGFAGCAVALVAAEWVDAFCPEICRRYQIATGISPSVYRARATEGASLLEAGRTG
jgi:galactokinase